jgi:uncharacterized PurR-regulated membrane protein YhhQ (DUF165 family)
VLLAVGAFVGLQLLRGLDDNRLTSWQWVFAGADLSLVLAVLVGGLVAALGLSRAALRIPAPEVVLGGVAFIVATFIGMIVGAYFGVKFFNWWTERQMEKEFAAFDTT